MNRKKSINYLKKLHVLLNDLMGDTILGTKYIRSISKGIKSLEKNTLLVDNELFNVKVKNSKGVIRIDVSSKTGEIIDTIKERIHPEEAVEGYALEYPDLVYVDFEGEAKEYLPKFYRSFISEVTVNNSSGEGMSFYKSGAPVTVELGIRFNETNIITRNVLRDGQ